MENTLRARVESIAQLKNGLMLNDVKIKDLSEMLQNASESAEQNKQSLTRRVSDLVNSNKLLEEEIKQERRRGEDLENDLIACERRLEESLAKLAAQERTAEGLSEINAKDQELLMKRLKEHTAEVEKLNAERCRVQADIREWETKLEDEKLEKNRAEKHLREEKRLTDKLRSQLEERLNAELEQKSRIKMLTEHNKNLDKELEEKTEEESKLKIELDEYTSQVDILTTEVREQELKNKELSTVQDENRNKIHDLESALKKQEQQHLADARAVKLSIISLQDALVEKVNTVEHLVKTTQQTKAKAKGLQEQLDATERAAASNQKRFESELQDEQRLAAKLRGEIDAKRRELKTLTESIEVKGEKIANLEITLRESSNQSEILKSEASTKRKEAEMMEDALEAKTSREREMIEQIASREEEIAKIRLSKRERQKREAELKKQLKAAQFENKLLKNQIQEKMKAERYLLAELEAQRLHISENSHPESKTAIVAQVKADKDLNEVLKNAAETD